MRPRHPIAANIATRPFLDEHKGSIGFGAQGVGQVVLHVSANRRAPYIQEPLLFRLTYRCHTVV